LKKAYETNFCDKSIIANKNINADDIEGVYFFDSFGVLQDAKSISLGFYEY
jgi:hypothetical protein